MAFDSVRINLIKWLIIVLPERVLLALMKIHYARVLRTVSESFVAEFRVIKALVNAGDQVIDLGAHVGIYTKFLSTLVGLEGNVFSVEPFPFNFAILSSNIRRLRLRNVKLINCAVSDVEGRVTMEVPKFTQSGESFWDARIAHEDSNPNLRQAEVPVRPLDSIFPDLTGVSFIKCDVEGEELHTLTGAQGLIERNRPAWLLEISLLGPSLHDQIRELLAQSGYTEVWFTGKELKLWEPGDKPIDAFFLQPQQLERAKESTLSSVAVSSNGVAVAS
jgi:FkbM family methyltransferase